MKLYDYQQEVADEGLRILNEHGMLYLALIMRFGKTPITLDILQRQNPEQSILFVTTKSAIKGIYDVAEHFNLKNLKVTNYEQLHKLENRNYDTLVLDEAHASLSSFPKKTKRRKEIDTIEHKQTVLLSGTPQIEASSQLFHQLTCHKAHPFSEYKNFYKWHDDFGIKGLTICTGGPTPAVDYSQTVDFSEYYRDILITRSTVGHKQAVFSPKIEKRYIPLDDVIKPLYRDMKTTGLCKVDGQTIIANNGAAKLSKLHQLAQGHILDELEETHFISEAKAAVVVANHPDAVIFYKYKADYEILSRYVPGDRLHQIDSSSTGLDLSHYDEMVIYSLTFSGANFAQALSRLVNVNRHSIPSVYIYLTKGTVDEKVYKEVVEKHDSNIKFLEGDNG